MSDDGSRRVWTIENDAMHEGPLQIIEDKTCPGAAVVAPHRVSERQILRANGDVTIAVRYELSKPDGCALEFHLPTNKGKLGPEYRQFMLYRVFVNNRQLNLVE